MIIGLTGVFGSGKSEVARVFEKLGARIVSADDIGKAIVDSDSITRYRLVMAFGGSILTKDQRVDRRSLGRLAFESPVAAKRLNEIVHPALLRELDDILTRHRGRRRHLVIDAALLVNWGLHHRMDTTILVTAPSAARIRRLSAKGFSQIEIRNRTRAQLTEAVLKRRADIVFSNDGTLSELQIKARDLYFQLTKNG